MIIHPNGVGLATRTTLPMSARQVTWFIDPEALLRHLADLHTVKVAAYCQHCYNSGNPDDVTATFNPSTRKWTLRCACADYHPVVDRGTGQALEIHQPNDDGTVKIHKMHSVDELLTRLGWSFKCAGECERLGMHDGIQGDNDTQTHTLKVSCGCTVRTYQEPMGLPS